MKQKNSEGEAIRAKHSGSPGALFCSLGEGSTDDVLITTFSSKKKPCYSIQRKTKSTRNKKQPEKKIRSRRVDQNLATQ